MENGTSSPAALAEIVNGTPLIEVSVCRGNRGGDYINVRVQMRRSVLLGLTALFLLAAKLRRSPLTTRSSWDALVASYPDHLKGHEGNDIVWKDDTRMPFDDGKPGKPFPQLLDLPLSRICSTCPTSWATLACALKRDTDPGRVRYEPFFTKMYGDCRKRETAKSMVDVIWLPKQWASRSASPASTTLPRS